MPQGVVIDPTDNCLLNRNPATGELISRVRCNSVEELDVMIQKSKVALESWSQLSSFDRISFLTKGLMKIEECREDFIDLIVKEMGKPIAQANEEMDGAIEKKGEYMELLLQAQSSEQHGTSLVVRQPYGVVIVLSPWNFPVDEILLLTLPALAAGNTVLVKPSEVTPECGALLVGKCLASVLPPDVIQLAQGDGTVVGPYLVSHPLVDMIAMTGSSATGKAILAASSQTLKRVVLELGGKDAMIIFQDADLDKAARDAVECSLSNAGQVCCSVERIFVDETIRDEFQTKVLEYVQSFRVGNGMDPTIQVGPLVSQLQWNHVKSHVDSAIREGAQLLYQSDIPPNLQDEDKDSISSFFFPITVLSNVTRDMKIYREETFGPVLCITTFDGTEQTAVHLANDTAYGLSGSVYTSDSEKARRVASQMHCGQVGVNCYAIANMHVACPWYVRYHTSFSSSSSSSSITRSSIFLNVNYLYDSFLTFLIISERLKYQGRTQAFWVRLSFWYTWISSIFDSQNNCFR
jgi:acyl-CoA reductase-like NAD-dependent aldehyde dehydrogenase